MKNNFVPRDVSWLSFNARVLQEANDTTVPLSERIKFLGIHSNNQDEFFRVRVAGLKRIISLGEKKNASPNRKTLKIEQEAADEMEQIQSIVLQQQNEFNRIWKNILEELAKEKIFLKTNEDLNAEQKKFVEDFFDETVESNVIPLLLNSHTKFPYLRDKSIYLGIAMRKNDTAYDQKFALIEVPVTAVGRFVQLPSKTGETNIILLEDVIRYNLKYIFSYFEYDVFEAHIFKVTKDAEFDVDNDINTSIQQKVEKGVKNRRKGKPVRFVYDKQMNAALLTFLIRKLGLSQKDSIIPGGRIHNFRHFMDFPDIIKSKSRRKSNRSIDHPAFPSNIRVTDVITNRDVLISTPYHTFTPLITLLREAAMDPDVISIKLAAYRLASHSKIINALINAVRNGKEVTVMMELKARFDEEANLMWKEILEEEGVKVLVGIPNMKVHAKICVIKKRVRKGKILQYGFVSTGNLNEKTAKIYGDHTLLTSNRMVMADINKIFKYIQYYETTSVESLRKCDTLLVCPVEMRDEIIKLIDNEIKLAKAKKPAMMIIKINSLSDRTLISKLYEAAEAGVEIKLVVRGIFCALTENKKFSKNIYAISIVDEYLEHARVMIFNNGGKERIFISSADWMVRNLDHRIEAAIEVTDAAIKQELKDIMNIQLSDNVKARLHNANNKYVPTNRRKPIRSQLEIYKYLQSKANKETENNSK